MRPVAAVREVYQSVYRSPCGFGRPSTDKRTAWVLSRLCGRTRPVAAGTDYVGSTPTRSSPLQEERTGSPVAETLLNEIFFGIIATKVPLLGGNPRQTTPLESPLAQSVAEHRPCRATDKAALCHRRVCASGRMPPCSEVIPPRPTVGPVTRPHGAAAYPTTAAPGFWGRLPLSLSRAVSLARFGSPSSRASALFDTLNPHPCGRHLLSDRQEKTSPHIHHGSGAAGERKFRHEKMHPP